MASAVDAPRCGVTTTFGLPSGEAGIAAFNRLRAHIPDPARAVANSPFLQGRDTGLASARTPLFQAFPRVGIPRAFGSYGEYVRGGGSMPRPR